MDNFPGNKRRWPIVHQRRFRILSAILFCLFISASAFATVGACSDYSNSGALARATVRETQVELELRGKNETEFSKLPLDLKIPATACTAFFSQDETYVALGFHNPQKPKQNIQLAVLRVETRHWVDQVPLVVTMAADSRGTLRGFISDTHTLVVMNNGTWFENERSTSVFPVLIDVDTGNIRTSAMAGSGFGVTVVSSVADVAENRLWLRDKHLPCTLRAFVIDTADRKSVKTAQSEAVGLGCSITDLLAAARPAFLLQATREADKTIVRRLDWKTKAVTQIELGKGARKDSYLPSGGVLATSDDGAVVALTALHLRKGRLGSAVTDPVLVVIGAEPLHVIGTLPFPEGSSGLALHHDGEATSVSYFDGRDWKAETVKESTAETVSK